MRIGVNCLSINPDYMGGINSYTFGLLRGFHSLNSDHTFQIYVNPQNAFRFDEFRNLPEFKIIQISDRTTLLKKALKRIAMLTASEKFYKFAVDILYSNATKALNNFSDVVYTPSTVLFPFQSGKKTIVSMHDIQQVHYPEFFSQHERLYRRLTYNLTSQYADFIQASSEFIKEDLLQHFEELAPSRIVVIPEGVDIETFSKANDHEEEIFTKYKIPQEFLFFPAQLWHHKNHITVLKALHNIQKQKGITIPLVMTGATYSAADNIFKYIKDNDMDYVHYLGKVPFSDLVSLYRKAKILITAVLYESSSLCVLESAAAGTPIIASKTPPNLEMSQNLNLNLFSPLDILDLEMVLLKVWHDTELRNKQVSHNKKSISYYSWQKVAQRYLSFLEENI